MKKKKKQKQQQQQSQQQQQTQQAATNSETKKKFKVNIAAIFAQHDTYLEHNGQTGRRFVCNNQPTRLQNVRFDERNLSEAELRNNNFQGTTFFKTKCINTDLEQSKFINLKATNANFESANLRKTEFTNINCDNTNFTNAKLENAKFGTVSLINANFTGANLKNTIFTSVNLEKANFAKANLDKANLLKTALENTNFEEANLKNCKLPLAELRKAKNLDKAKNLSAKYKLYLQFFPPINNNNETKIKNQEGVQSQEIQQSQFQKLEQNISNQIADLKQEIINQKQKEKEEDKWFEEHIDQYHKENFDDEQSQANHKIEENISETKTIAEATKQDTKNTFENITDEDISKYEPEPVEATIINKNGKEEPASIKVNKTTRTATKMAHQSVNMLLILLAKGAELTGDITRLKTIIEENLEHNKENKDILATAIQKGGTTGESITEKLAKKLYHSYINQQTLG